MFVFAASLCTLWASFPPGFANSAGSKLKTPSTGETCGFRTKEHRCPQERRRRQYGPSLSLLPSESCWLGVPGRTAQVTLTPGADLRRWQEWTDPEVASIASPDVSISDSACVWCDVFRGRSLPLALPVAGKDGDGWASGSRGDRTLARAVATLAVIAGTHRTGT